jgi:hypothetical protein
VIGGEQKLIHLAFTLKTTNQNTTPSKTLSNLHNLYILMDFYPPLEERSSRPFVCPWRSQVDLRPSASPAPKPRPSLTRHRGLSLRLPPHSALHSIAPSTSSTHSSTPPPSPTRGIPGSCFSTLSSRPPSIIYALRQASCCPPLRPWRPSPPPRTSRTRAMRSSRPPITSRPPRSTPRPSNWTRTMPRSSGTLKPPLPPPLSSLGCRPSGSPLSFLFCLQQPIGGFPELGEADQSSGRC